MILVTKHFGSIEIEENQIYKFPEGIPGFEGEKSFALILSSDLSSPFKWLQSINNSELAFATIDPFSVINDYEVDVPDCEIAQLGIENIGDILLLSIVVVPEDIKKISANLLAPIVINTCNNTAKQITAKTDKYSIRHYIFEELQRNGGDR